MALEDVRVDFHWVVLAPARMVRDLLVLARCTIQNIQVLVDQKHTTRSGPLVNSHKVLRTITRHHTGVESSLAKAKNLAGRG